MKRNKYLRGIVLFIISIVLSFHLYAQDIDTQYFDERLKRIEKNIGDLQKNKLQELEKNISSGYISRVEERFGVLETQYQTNFGKYEELENKIEKLENKFNLLNQELNFRLNEISKKIDNLKINSLSIEYPEVQNQSEEINQKSVNSNTDDNQPKNFSDKDIKINYENAIKLLWSNELDKALEELIRLKKQNPDDLMPNIQYWLGEVYYAKKNFEQAVIEFGEGLKLFPSSIKGPDNMLKLGLSFSNLNKKLESCNVLIELEIKYPEAAKNVLQRAQKEKKKLNCSEE